MESLPKTTFKKCDLGCRYGLPAQDYASFEFWGTANGYAQQFTFHLQDWKTKWVFPKIGIPQIIHFNRGFPLFSPSILGAHPYFWKHPNMSRELWSRKKKGYLNWSNVEMIKWSKVSCIFRKGSLTKRQSSELTIPFFEVVGCKCSYLLTKMSHT